MCASDRPKNEISTEPLYARFVKNHHFTASQTNHYSRQDYETQLPKTYQKIVKGGKLAGKLLQQEPIHLDGQKAYLHGIVQLYYFLYALSLGKNRTEKGFSDGVILVHDPKQLFYTFLKAYEQCLRENQWTTDVTRFIALCNTSHLKESNPLAHHYAIAMRSNENANTETLLPNNKRALLFIKDESNNTLFLKAEDWYRPEETSGPVIGWLASQMQKNVSPHIGLGSIDDDEYNKERMPQWLWKDFKHVIRNTISNFHARHQFRQDHGTRVQSMIRGLKALQDKKTTTKDQKDSIQDLVDKIRIYLDYTELRHGNEIILKDELPIAAHYYATSDEDIIDIIDLFFTIKHNVFMFQRNETIHQRDVIMQNISTFIERWQHLQSDLPEDIAPYMTAIYEAFKKPDITQNLHMSIFE
jgi:hypothetical protein